MMCSGSKRTEALGRWSKKLKMTVSKCSVMFVGKSKNVQLKKMSYKLNNEIIPTANEGSILIPVLI